MKLLELLARELVEWPEGAKRASQDKDKEIRFDTSWNDFYVETLADDAGVDFGDGVIVTREEWESERAKVEGKTEWDGEGLPPVGTECEAHDYGKYRAVSIVAHDGEYALCRLGKGEYMAGNSGSFRPIRTQEQIAAQEREEAITDLMQTTCIRRGEAARIYDAGYRKQEQSE